MNRKESLIKAAKELIEHKGYNDINVEDITKLAGVAKGTFYTYFKKKEDIISAITLKSFEKIRDQSYLKEGDLITRIQQFFTEVSQEIEDIGIEICRAWLSSSIKLENNSGIYSLEFYLDTISTYLEKALIKKEIKERTPILELTQQIVALFFGLITFWCITNNKIELTKTTRSFCQLSLPDILKPYLS